MGRVWVVGGALLFLCSTPALAQIKSANDGCSADREFDRLQQHLSAAAEKGALSEYLTASAVAFPQLESACGWSKSTLLDNLYFIMRLLIIENKYDEIDEIANSLLRTYSTRLDFADVRSTLQLYRVVSSVDRRDLRASTERFLLYEGDLSGGRDPRIGASAAETLRSCLEFSSKAEVFVGDQPSILNRCRGGAYTRMYGAFIVRDDGGMASDQCPPDNPPIAIDQAAETGPFGSLRPALVALNSMCTLDNKLLSALQNWYSISAQSHKNEGLSQKAAKIQSILSLMSEESEKFDPGNPVSAFQFDALSFFIAFSTDMQMRETFEDKILWVGVHDKLFTGRFAALLEKYKAAFPLILQRKSGFLKTDNIGLAAFIASQAYPWGKIDLSNDVWTLVGATYGDSTRAEPTNTLAAVRAGLTDDEIMISAVHAVDSYGALLVSTRDGSAVTELGAATREANDAASLIRDAVSSAPRPGSGFPLTASRLLYTAYICNAEVMGMRYDSAFIAPISSGPSTLRSLAGTPRNTLVFVPDATMERIPISLLAEPTGGCIDPLRDFDSENSIYAEAPPESLRSAKWLIETHNFRVMPYEAISRQSPSAAQIAYLGVGAPTPTQARYAKSDNPLVIQSNIASDVVQSTPLEGAELEFEKISHIPRFEGSPVIAGPAATEAAVRKGLQRTPAILHFATHALDPASVPGIIEPLIVLRQPADVSTFKEQDDGVLTASEISRLNLPQVMVILSACRTASPRLGVGRGIFSGLVQSFFDAGAKSAIATYWAVDDQSAADIIPSVLGNISKGRDVADSLRAAQIDYLKRQRASKDELQGHPYYWAPFVAVTPLLQR